MINQKEVKRAVSNAVSKPEQFPSDIKDDLLQQMWVELLQSPGNVKRLESASYSERVKMLTKNAKQVLWELSYGDRHNLEEIFASVEMVKDVLKGDKTMSLLVQLVGAARLELEFQDNPYAEAIRNRYDNGEIPRTKDEDNRQTRAHIKLTDEVNAGYRRLFEPPESYYDCSSTPFPVLGDGPGSKNVVYAETRKPKGGYNDPTADAAIALLSAGPEERARILEETPLAEVMKGNK